MVRMCRRMMCSPRSKIQWNSLAVSKKAWGSPLIP
jgi:hypothetical protein